MLLPSSVSPSTSKLHGFSKSLLLDGTNSPFSTLDGTSIYLPSIIHTSMVNSTLGSVSELFPTIGCSVDLIC